VVVTGFVLRAKSFAFSAESARASDTRGWRLVRDEHHSLVDGTSSGRFSSSRASSLRRSRARSDRCGEKAEDVDAPDSNVRAIAFNRPEQPHSLSYAFHRVSFSSRLG
jgi:hypothetical protein